jgi:hypothetical protein
MLSRTAAGAGDLDEWLVRVARVLTLEEAVADKPKS